MKSKRPDFPPIISLLLQGCIYPLPSNLIEPFRINLQTNINWEKCLVLSHYHGVFPPFYKNILGVGRGLLPSALQERFDKECAHNRAYALQIELEYAVIAAAFSKNRVESCAIKGPFLSRLLFGVPDMRVSGDLDVLIRQDDTKAAHKVLSDLGYQRTFPNRELSSLQKRIFHKLQHHYGYMHPDRGISMELHWAIAAQQHLPLPMANYFWESTISDLAIAPFSRTLGLEPLIAMLIMHGSKHMWSQLKWIVDIANFVERKAEVDWSLVRSILQSAGWTRAFDQCVGMINALFPEISTSLMGQAFPEKWMLADSLRAISSEPRYFARHGGLKNIFHQMYLQRMHPGWSSFWLQIWSLFIQIEDWEQISLPDYLFPLYLFFRPLFWFWRNHISRKSFIRNQLQRTIRTQRKKIATSESQVIE